MGIVQCCLDILNLLAIDKCMKYIFKPVHKIHFIFLKALLCFVFFCIINRKAAKAAPPSNCLVPKIVNY